MPKYRIVFSAAKRAGGIMLEVSGRLYFTNGYVIVYDGKSEESPHYVFSQSSLDYIERLDT